MVAIVSSCPRRYVRTTQAGPWLTGLALCVPLPPTAWNPDLDADALLLGLIRSTGLTHLPAVLTLIVISVVLDQKGVSTDVQ